MTKVTYPFVFAENTLTSLRFEEKHCCLMETRRKPIFPFTFIVVLSFSFSFVLKVKGETERVKRN